MYIYIEHQKYGKLEEIEFTSLVDASEYLNFLRVYGYRTANGIELVFDDAYLSRSNALTILVKEKQ